VSALSAIRLEDLIDEPNADYKFELPEDTAPPAVDDEIRRKEEEDLQRVLEMSMQDLGGRPQWTQYSLAPASSTTANGPASGPSASPAPATSNSTVPASHPFAQPKYPGGGYVPARTPSPAATPQQQKRYQPPQTQPQPQSQTTNLGSSALSTSATISSTTPATSPASAVPETTTATPAATSGSAMAETGNIVTRVRALYTFEPTESGELAFEKGDIIKVVDRGYKDWWRGQLKGRTGIFPVNYVVRFMFLVEVSESFLLTCKYFSL
jgi:signal transducing adaptor molecule